MRTSSTVILILAGIALGAAATSLPPVRNLLVGQEKADPPKSADKEISSPAAEARQTIVRMSADQVVDQGIAVTRAGDGLLARHVNAPATVIAASNRIARVPVRVIGTVTEMRKQLGDRATKDEIVAVLDSREAADAKTDYLTATVNAELQKTNYARAATLWDKRISAESQYLQMRATYLEAQLRLELARQKLSALGLDARDVAEAAKKEQGEGIPSSLRRYELRAPLSGRVIERKVDVGTSVGKEGDPADVYTIADLSVVWAELSVLTTDADQVKEGARVLVLAGNDDPIKQREGRVIFVSPVLNPDTRSARVIAELPNEDGFWRPGTFVSVEIEIARDNVDVLVPRTALQTIGGRSVVFVRTDGGFERRAVALGRSDDDSIEIVSGLAAGTEVAVKNSFLLKAELGKASAADDE